MLQYVLRVWIEPVDIWYWAYCSLNSEEKLTLFWDQWFGVLSSSGITDTVDLFRVMCASHTDTCQHRADANQGKSREFPGGGWDCTGKRATFNFDHIHLVNQLMLSGFYDCQLRTVEMSGYKWTKQKTIDLLPSLANQDILHKARLVQVCDIFGLHKHVLTKAVFL